MICSTFGGFVIGAEDYATVFEQEICEHYFWKSY